MQRRHALVPALLALATTLGCSHRPAAEDSLGTARVAPDLVDAASDRCETATCQEDLAQRALEDGVLDVASVHLRHAFELQPAQARLEAYLSRLERNGERRALATALETHGTDYPDLIAPYRQRLDTSPSDQPTQLWGEQPILSTALAAARASEYAEALAALEGAEHPVLVALRGRLHHARGAHREARTSYAQARIAIDERGATMRLGPYETGFATDLAYVDEHPVRVSGWRPRLHTETVGVSRLEFLGSSNGHAKTLGVLQELLLPAGNGRVAGVRFYAQSPTNAGELDVFDLHTGTKLGAIATPLEPKHSFEVIDEGPLRRFLVHADEQHLVLLRIPDVLGGSAELEVLGTFEYTGTTPTITRAYTGNGAEHRNILNDTPSWPVSFAVSPDLEHFAYGTSDSVVHLHEMKSRTGKVLKVDWEYEERRMGGANADRNNPIDLSFTAKGLVVVYGRGDVLTFSIGGKRIAWRRGACAPKALRAYAGRYGAATATPEDREYCGRFQDASISPSGERVAGTGPFDLRVIPRTATGNDVEAYVGTNLGAHVMTWVDETRVLFGNLYGHVWEWNEGKPVRSLTEVRDGMSNGPRQPRLSSDLRVLQWGGDYKPFVAWDLWTGARLEPDASRPNVHADPSAAYTAERDGTGIVIRDADDARAYPFETGTCASATFLNDGPFVLTSRDDGVWLVDLQSKTEVELDVGPGQVARPASEVALSRDGTHLAIYAQDATINIYDAKSGARTKKIAADPGEYHRALAIAPDGTWVAWQEQLPRPGKGLPDVMVHLVGLVRGVEDRETKVPGWTKALVPHPHGKELLLVTENSLTRWNPLTGEVISEDVGSLAANSLHYAQDAQLIIVERYDQVEIRSNAEGLPLLARIHLLEGENWFVETGSGSVDGSTDAPHSLATIVEGPMDTSVLPGEVAWDRFVVPGLLADAPRYLQPFPSRRDSP